MAFNNNQELGDEFKAALWQERLEDLDQYDLADLALKPVHTLRHIPLNIQGPYQTILGELFHGIISARAANDVVTQERMEKLFMLVPRFLLKNHHLPKKGARRAPKPTNDVSSHSHDSRHSSAGAGHRCYDTTHRSRNQTANPINAHLSNRPREQLPHSKAAT